MALTHQSDIYLRQEFPINDRMSVGGQTSCSDKSGKMVHDSRVFLKFKF